MKNLAITILLLGGLIPIWGQGVTFRIKDENEIYPNVIVTKAKTGMIANNDAWYMIGEIQNKSSVRYKGSYFRIVFYGDGDELLNSAACPMSDIPPGKTKSFECAVSGPDYQEIRYIKIEGRN